MSEKRWSEERGREVVGQWRRSGQSMAEFSRKQGCNEQRLRYWRERVGAEPAAAGRSQKLLPGVVVNVGASAPVSVVLPRGVVVEARAVGDIPAAWVAEVVRALELGS